MNTIEEYLQQAEACERVAATCVSASNREILLNTAAQWRRMADDIVVAPP